MAGDTTRDDARLSPWPASAPPVGDARGPRHRHQLGPRRRGPDDRRRRRAPLRDPRAGEGGRAPRVERAATCRAVRRRHRTGPSPALDRFRQVAAVHDAPITAVATSAVREAENRDVFIDRAWLEAGVHVDVISGRGGGPPHPPRRAAGRAGVRPPAPAVRHRRRQHRAARRPARRGARVPLAQARAPSASPAASSTATGSTRARSTRAAVTSARPSRPFAREVRRFDIEVAVGSSGTVAALAEMAAVRATGERPRAVARNRTLTRDELDDVVRDLVKAPDHGGPGGAARARPGPGRHHPGRRADPRAGAARARRRRAARLRLRAARGRAARHLAAPPRRLAPPPVRPAPAQRARPRPADGRGPGPLGPGRPPRARAVRRHRRAATASATTPARSSRRPPCCATWGCSCPTPQHHKHSYYVIRGTDRLAGFTDHEVERIALVARYHRKSEPKAKHPEFAALDDEDQHLVRCLAGLLRVAIGLDRNHAGRVAEVEVSDERQAARGDGHPGRGRGHRPRALRGGRAHASCSRACSACPSRSSRAAEPARTGWGAAGAAATRRRRDHPGAGDRQLRQLRLQPRPVPGRARRRAARAPPRRAHHRRDRRARARRRAHLARARARPTTPACPTT